MLTFARCSYDAQALEQLRAEDATHHVPALRAALSTRAAADADARALCHEGSPSLPPLADLDEPIGAATSDALYYGFRLSAPTALPLAPPPWPPQPRASITRTSAETADAAHPQPSQPRRVGAALALPALRAILHALVGGVAGDVDGAHRFYDARARVALRRMASHLRVPWEAVARLESALAAEMKLEAPLEAELLCDDAACAEPLWPPRLSLRHRAAVAGAVLLGGGAFALSAGLAAPAIAAGAAAAAAAAGSTGAAATASAAAGSAATSAAAAAAGGALGGAATGARMHTRLRGLSDAAFVPISPPDDDDAAPRPPRLAVTLCIAGWLRSADDVTAPWACLASGRASADCFALRWESELLLSLGAALPTMLRGAVAQSALQHGIATTALAGLATALAPPLAVRSATSALDNDWSVALQRADRAGALLAAALAAGAWAGGRPVTLVAYGVGARVAFAALTTLGHRGHTGAVEHAVLMGAPIPCDAPADWTAARTATAGRLIAARCTSDLALATLYRAEHLGAHPAGLRAVAGAAELGIECADVSDLVVGHAGWPEAVPRVMARLRLRAHDEAEP